MQKLSVTYVRNWQENRRHVATGHVYQVRYKSFAGETDEYFYQVARCVERNALRELGLESTMRRRGVLAKSGDRNKLDPSRLVPSSRSDCLRRRGGIRLHQRLQGSRQFRVFRCAELADPTSLLASCQTKMADESRHQAFHNRQAFRSLSKSSASGSADCP